MDNRFFNSYPYTDFHELNLSWVISELRSFATTLEQFVSINALKYADPIQWNITSQYEKNTIVIDPQTGTAYISVAPVPSGVALTNTDYWTIVFDLGSFVTRAAQNFTNRWEEETTSTATFPTNAGDWLVWGDVLYEALVNITAGDTYVVNSNIRHITMEEIIGHLEDLSTTDKSNLVAAINEVLQTLADTAGDLDSLTTTDKSNLVAAINEVVSTITSIIADISDINTALGDTALVSNSTITKTINNNYLGSKFLSERLGSFQHDYGVQAGVYYNGSYYIVGSTNSTTDFKIYVVNDVDMTVDSESVFTYAIHPNSMFEYQDKLYIVDSTAHDVYIIDIATLTLDQVITSLEGYNIGSAAVQDDKFYFRGSSGGDIILVKTDDSFNVLDDSVILEDPTSISGATVSQTIFIKNDIIYFVMNRPNTIICYDMEGHIVATKDVGVGSGYYPYGEIESLFYRNDKICLLSALVCNYGGYFTEVGQVFITNIDDPTIIGDNRYGQSKSPHNRLRINNTGTKTKNPDGINNPFFNIFEGGCVYEYLQHRYDFVGALDIEGTFTTPGNNVLMLQNVIVGPWHPYATIDNVDLENCSVHFNRATINNTYISSCDITYDGGTIHNLDVRDCHVVMNGTVVDTSINAVRSSLDGYFILDGATESYSACYNSHYKYTYHGDQAITVNPTKTYNGLMKDIMSVANIADLSFNIHYWFYCEDYGLADVSVFLSRNELNNLVGSPRDRYIAIPLNNHAGATYMLTMRIRVEANQMTFNDIAVKDLSGTSQTTGTWWLLDVEFNRACRFTS